MKKIDMHVHTRMPSTIGRLANGQTYATPLELHEMYEKIGVETGVILPRVSPECALDVQSNENAKELADKYNMYWFCNIDPRFGGNTSDYNLSYFLEYYKALGAKGVGEVVTNLYFDHPLMQNLFYHCEKTGLPLLFHIAPQIGGYYGIVDDLGLPRLEISLAKYPNLTFIGHSQPFWAEISKISSTDSRNAYPTGKVTPGRVVELMQKYPNLHADLSAGSGYNAIFRDPEFGVWFLETFSDRLYYATDICAPENIHAPFITLSHRLDELVEQGKISDSAYRKISKENALKILEN